MNEIKRMQQLAGLNEIKINNPTDYFIVTEHGKGVLKEFILFEKLSEKFGCGELLKNEGGESELYSIPQILYIFSDTYGEGIIKINEINRMEDFMKKYIDIWAGEDDAEKDLYNLRKLNLIK